ncbi:MAG: thiolase family protein, partial [Desulfobacterales bacterium]|nr:thiolase family protein [Desulfobacterales bacterium]
MRDAYIVTSIRTPGCKMGKGAFKDTRPEDLLAFILSTAIKKTPNLSEKDVDDIMIGCCFPEAEQGFNIGRIVGQMAGFPVEVAGATVNRFCSSGLEAICQAALRVMAGWAEVTIGGGVESMSMVPMGGNMPRPHPEYSRTHPELYLAMGITAENVARKFKISREAQDEFAFHSHMKAAEARRKNLFTELIPTPAARYILSGNGTYMKEMFVQSFDDGIREKTSMDTLSRLKPAFSEKGTVTAGNSSQTTDGAAASVIMCETMVKKLDLKPIARLISYATVGCRPEEMGVGPKYAIPKVLKMAGLEMGDIGVFEINEAFACQALYCAQELNLDINKVNIHGGAIALGHPLGCTGAKLCATLLANMIQ